MSDGNHLTIMEELYSETCYWCGKNKFTVCGVFILLAAAGITTTVLLTKSTTTFPCVTFSAQTPATQVSIACMQYLWTKAGCLTPSIYPPNGYTGFWTQSPQGLVMVKCVGQATCGVGSYQNIMIYLQYCNTNFVG